MNFEQPKQPTPEEWDDIFNAPPPTEAEIASRKNPDDIADMSGENLLGHRDRTLNKDASAMEEARAKIAKIIAGK